MKYRQTDTGQRVIKKLKLSFLVSVKYLHTMSTFTNKCTIIYFSLSQRFLYIHQSLYLCSFLSLPLWLLIHYLFYYFLQFLITDHISHFFLKFITFSHFFEFSNSVLKKRRRQYVQSCNLPNI